MIDRRMAFVFEVVIPVLGVILIVAFIAYSFFSDWRFRQREKLRLITEGRCIEGGQAIKLFRDEKGRILLNLAFPPGKWWFIYESDWRPFPDTEEAVENHGLLLYPLTKEVVQELEEMGDSIEILLACFED